MAHRSLEGRHVLLCSCRGSIPLDREGLVHGLLEMGARPDCTSSHLCRSGIGRFHQALETGEPLLVACEQEETTFRDAAGDAGDRIVFTDIRDRAGWSGEGNAATDKMIALMAADMLVPRPALSLTIRSGGVCLVCGRGQQAWDAAQELAAADLAVTLLLCGGEDEVLPPRLRTFPVFRGRIVSLGGALGAFEVRIDACAAAEPAGRGEQLVFGDPVDGAVSHCDMVLDLSGGPPLLSAPEKRDGYLRPDPARGEEVARALLQATRLVGEFEKPVHVDFNPGLCAHSRSRKTGCTRCLSVCPVGAAGSDGDCVRIDPHICAGCGACAAVCPSGAVTMALPPPGNLALRMETLLRHCRPPGGAGLLFHDERRGAGLLSLSARFGRGLPARILPLAVSRVTGLAHDLMLAALAMGAATVRILADPADRDDIEVLEAQIALANTLVRGLSPGEDDRIRLVMTIDPDRLEESLWMPDPAPFPVVPVSPLGGRRDLTRLAVRTLAAACDQAPEILPVPEVSFPDRPPWGRVILDEQACTLCLSCVGLCPSRALLDGSDRPQLLFREADCLQCGLCVRGCPESALTLEARYHTGPDATRHVLLKEEEPFCCISCGKPFGVKSSIDRVIRQLAGKNRVFAQAGRERLIMMCENCRVVEQFRDENAPMKGGPPRPVRTTGDYLSGRIPAAPGGATSGDTAPGDATPGGGRRDAGDE